MFSKPGHVIMRAVKALSWRGRVLAATVAVLMLGAGAGVAGAAMSASSGIPTQGVRVAANTADWCIHYGSNTLVYDWNQAACPAGTYPLSFVSAPDDFALTYGGATEQCKLTGNVSAGNESDAITCSAVAPAVTTGAGIPTSSTTAALTGTVNPNGGKATSCTFYYRPATGYTAGTALSGDAAATKVSATPATLSGGTAQNVAAAITFATAPGAGTAYVFQLSCSDSGTGLSSTGTVGTFTMGG